MVGFYKCWVLSKEVVRMIRNQYSLSEFISTSWAFVLTKISYPQARLVRRPVYMRGKHSLVGGKGLTTGHGCRFDLKGDIQTLFIGDNCEIGDNVHIVAYENVKIGNNVLMASKIFVSDTNHGVYKNFRGGQDSPLTAPNDRQLVTNPTSIGNNVWIGENVVVLPGSTIGNGCIIGANAVVSGFIEDNSIAVGSPAKVIKHWNKSTRQWEGVTHEG